VQSKEVEQIAFKRRRQTQENPRGGAKDVKLGILFTMRPYVVAGLEKHSSKGNSWVLDYRGGMPTVGSIRGE